MRRPGVLASLMAFAVLAAAACDDEPASASTSATTTEAERPDSGVTPLPEVPDSRGQAGETATTAPSTTAVLDPYLEARMRMVDVQIAARGIEDPLVLDAMRAVPRHLFVPVDVLDMAYNDHALPIGFGQTISQPYIVALMSEALGVGPGDTVLEIGTGSGYQAAVLDAMGVEVYTIEIIPELAAQAEARLSDLGYEVATRNADGYFGWEEHAPFDGIIVTAAPDHVPQPLASQLAVGARMVIPIGPVGAVQTLWAFTSGDDGELLAENLGRVVFVPFTRD